MKPKPPDYLHVERPSGLRFHLPLDERGRLKNPKNRELLVQPATKEDEIACERQRQLGLARLREARSQGIGSPPPLAPAS